MKVGFDATPLLGARTGIGHYTQHLAAGLAQRSELQVKAVPFTLRGGSRPTDLAPEISWRHLPFPARLLQLAWSRVDFPPVQLISGTVDIFHGTNFVLPPSLGAPGVVTVHDLSFLRYPELVSPASLAYRALVPRAVRRAAAVLTPTAAVAAELIDAYGLEPAKVRVTPLGVDASWAAAQPLSNAELSSLGLPRNFLLAVGTLEPRKGLDLLISAYSSLLASGTDVPPLVLVGPDGWGPALDTARLPTDRVFLPGYLPHHTLRRVVASASVFVFPSRYEGFGLPPVEAMAAGVPVVASDIPTSLEVLGEHALLPPMGDVDALARAISYTLDKPPTLAQIAAAKAHALSWTWEQCVQQTVDAYSAVVSG